MQGYHFSKYDPNENAQTPFKKLLDLFTQLLQYTSGDAAESLQWLTQLDKEYKLTNDEYGIGDFIEDLKDNGYLKENDQDGTFKITPKTEQGIRKRSLEEIFGKMKKAKQGSHRTFKTGQGDEPHGEGREGRDRQSLDLPVEVLPAGFAGGKPAGHDPHDRHQLGVDQSPRPQREGQRPALLDEHG